MSKALKLHKWNLMVAGQLVNWGLVYWLPLKMECFMIFRATICGARIIWPLFFAHLSSQTDIRIASEVYEIMQTVYIPATKLKFIKATQKKVDQKLIKYITEAITSMNQHHRNNVSGKLIRILQWMRWKNHFYQILQTFRTRLYNI